MIFLPTVGAWPAVRRGGQPGGPAVDLGYQDRPSLFDAALDLAGLTGTETIIDVGCGDGRYLAARGVRGHRGALLGLDLSPGMAVVSARYGGAAVADARRLPIRTCAVVFACR